MREALIEALSAFAGAESARDGAAALLGALGYRSARTEDLGGVEGLIGLSGAGGGMTERRRALFDSWRSAEIVFQVTGEEIGEVRARQDGLFRAPGFDRGRIESFLFLAVVHRRAHRRDDGRDVLERLVGHLCHTTALVGHFRGFAADKEPSPSGAGGPGLRFPDPFRAARPHSSG